MLTIYDVFQGNRAWLFLEISLIMTEFFVHDVFAFFRLEN